jgi:hypothetical protein
MRIAATRRDRALLLEQIKDSQEMIRHSQELLKRIDGLLARIGGQAVARLLCWQLGTESEP